MKYEEAVGIVKEYQARASLTPDEEFLLLEAWSFLIEAEGESPDADIYIYNLANYYYRHGDFGLAKKYYEKAYDRGNVLAAQSLGDIWYQGLTGETDYEKAFRYYSVAATNGFPRSMIKLADMYRDGLFVNEDYEEYCRRIRKIYNRIWDSPVPNEKGAVFFPPG